MAGGSPSLRHGGGQTHPTGAGAWPLTLGSARHTRFEAVARSPAVGWGVASPRRAGLACGVRLLPLLGARQRQVGLHPWPIASRGSGCWPRKTARLTGNRPSRLQANASSACGRIPGRGGALQAAIQPQATSTSFSGLGAAGAGPLGPEISMACDRRHQPLLAALAHSRNAPRAGLTPLASANEALPRSACIVPQETTRALSVTSAPGDRPIAAGYLNGEPEGIASVDPWVGPQGAGGAL